jgi:hypothetical protein
MDGCSDAYNLTDCLLLSLLDAMKDHNKWDVPTLSVTVVIGFVALVFAAMTVIQNVLSAPSGHRKCSRDAISDWSQKTESRWNWAEFRWDSIANTPVLTSARIQAQLGEPGVATRTTSNSFKTLKSFAVYAGWNKGNDSPNGAVADGWTEKHADNGRVGKGPWARLFGSAMQQFDKAASSKSATRDRYYPATWLHLLEHISMKKFVWQHLQDRTRSTAADYLPSEVQAVPAYVDVDTIIALAATAGCDKLTMESESGYPRLTGTGVQIRFRRDPFLGVVASFEHYVSTAFEEDTCDGPLLEGTKSLTSRTESKFDSSHGNFRTHSDKFREDNIPDSGSGPFLQISAGVAEPHITGRAPRICVPDENSNGGTPCPHAGQLQLCGCWTLLIDLTKRYSFLWLLYDKPIDQRYIFPAKAAKVEEVLGTIVVQGSYWSKNHSISEGWIRSLLEEKDSKSIWHEDWTDPIYLNSLERWEICALCLHFTVDVGAGRRLFRRFPHNRRVRIRAAISKEMDEIDQTIANGRTPKRPFKPDSSSQCIMIEIYIRAATLMTLEPFEESMTKELYKVASSRRPDSDTKSKIGVTPRNILRLLKEINIKEGQTLIQLYDLFLGWFNVYVLIKSLFTLASTIPVEATRSATKGDFDPIKNPNGGFLPIDLMMESNDAMRELLIYRAVLFSIVCLTSLDNSDVLKSDIGNQIVPFL